MNESTWIPIKDRMPELGTYVLVFMARNGNKLPLMTVAASTLYGWWPFGEDRQGDVTHWMPLPKPPVSQML